MGVKNRAKKGKPGSPYSYGTSREERSKACDLISDFDIVSVPGAVVGDGKGVFAHVMFSSLWRS